MAGEDKEIKMLLMLWWM